MTPPATSQRSSAREQVAPHRVLKEFYTDPANRAPFVRRLFDDSACYYDRLSAALSFGSDRYYRKRVLSRAGLVPGLKLLDVATGTGLVVRAALDLGLTPDQVIGLDPSRGMLEENRKRNGVPLIQGAGENLPLADATFDLISMGYALRHVEDLGRLFREFHRVLKPGGRILVLELVKPRTRLGFFLMKMYVGKLLPRLIQLVTRRREPAQLMEYYWATIAECVPPATIMTALNESGFSDVRRDTTGSILSEYYAVKPRPPAATSLR